MGIKQDNDITNRIEKFIIDSLSEINAICFVCQSNYARLTINMKYVFYTILNLFGDDV